MRIRVALMLSLGLVLGLRGDLRAADPKPAATVAEDPAKLFDQLDPNHKGELTADEVPADKRHLFERLLRLAGKDAGGKLSRDEFINLLKTKEPPAAAPSSEKPATTPKSPEPANPPAAGNRLAPKVLADPGGIFDRLDKNKTGKISAADLPEGRHPLFERLLKALGKPEGSSLTRDEFIKGVAMLAGKTATQPGSSSEATPAKPAGEKPAAGKLNAANMDVDAMVKRVMQLSKRPDGKLTKADLPERMQARFDKIDANGDGLVSEAELRDWLTKVKRRLEMVEKATSKSSN